MPGIPYFNDGALLFGRVAEWTIAPVLKTGEPQGSGGSNPSPSALLRLSASEGRLFKRDENPRVPGFVYCRRREAAGMAGVKRQPPQGQEHRAMLAAIPPLPPSGAKALPLRSMSFGGHVGGQALCCI